MAIPNDFASDNGHVAHITMATFPGLDYISSYSMY